MLKTVFKNPLFLAGFLFIVGVLLCSFVYSKFYAPSYSFSEFRLNDEGLIVERAPFPPSLEFPLGTDQFGMSMVHMLLMGAKFTIGISIGLAFLRMVAGVLLGVLFYMLPKQVIDYFRNLIDSFHYAPVVIFAFLLLSPAYIAFNWSYNFDELFVYTLFVLAFLGVPILAIYVTDEIEAVYQMEFIRNSSLLGGSRLHILWKHVRLFLLPKLFLLFVQQISQILNLLAYLALLEIFFGGTQFILMSYDGNPKINEGRVIEAFSITGEWAGLIGKSWDMLVVYPWLIFAPVVAFTLTILATNFMIEGLQQATGVQVIKKKKRNKRTNGKETAKTFSFKKIS